MSAPLATPTDGRDAPARVRMGVLTDCHLAAPGTDDGRFNSPVRLGRSRELLVAALAWLDQRADALVLLGDLSQSATPEDYDYLVTQLATAKLPTYLVPGNHDFAANGERPAALLRALPDRVVIPPATGLGFGDIALASGDLTAEPDGYRLLVDGLGQPPDACPLVWLSHFPVLSLETTVHAHSLRYAGDLLNRTEIEATLRESAGPVIALTGHLHVRGHAIADNVLQLSMAALAEAPHDASVVSIEMNAGNLTVSRTCHPIADSDDDVAAFDAEHTAFRWDSRGWQHIL